MSGERLVSIAIAAYDQPEYTRRLLRSIAEQEHRPIEIVLSDDLSPRSLAPVAEELRVLADEGLVLKFFRQERRLGVMGNFLFALGQASGRYIVPFAHDNWFTDRRFLSEAVALMEQNPEIGRAHV